MNTESQHNQKKIEMVNQATYKMNVFKMLFDKGYVIILCFDGSKILMTVLFNIQAEIYFI